MDLILILILRGHNVVYNIKCNDCDHYISSPSIQTWGRQHFKHGSMMVSADQGIHWGHHQLPAIYQSVIMSCDSEVIQQSHDTLPAPLHSLLKRCFGWRITEIWVSQILISSIAVWLYFTKTLGIYFMCSRVFFMLKRGYLLLQLATLPLKCS